MKSDINGNGYGSKHTWQKFDTIQSKFKEERGTLYKCKKCKVQFRHYYHSIPNIFDAIEYSTNIPEECEVKE